MKAPKINKSDQILVIGDIMLDRYWWGDVGRISPEAPVPVIRLHETSVTAGGAANVAANISGLGATPILFGCVGDDTEGELIRELLPLVGVSPDNLIVEPGRPTTVKTRIVARNQHIARVDHEVTDLLSPETENTFLERIYGQIGSVKVIVISDYAKGVISEGLVRKVLETAELKGVRTVVDPKGTEFRKYRGATLLTPNKREAAEACRLDPDRADVVERAGSQLLSLLTSSAVLITEGDNGMTLFSPDDKPYHTDATAREVFDVTGAGDTVVAALAVALAGGSSLRDSTNFSNTAAGIAVEKVGTTVVTLEMIRERFPQYLGSDITV